MSKLGAASLTPREITTSHLAEAIQYRSLDRRRLSSPYETA